MTPAIMEIVMTMIPIQKIPIQKWKAAVIMSLTNQAERSRDVKAVRRKKVRMAGNKGTPYVSHHHIRRAGKIKSRTGLRMRGQRGHPEVRRALNQYARWLRKVYEFPIRVPVYLFPSRTIITQDGVHVSASFFAPFERDVEPLIRIATGDYPELKRLRGRNDALAACIMSLSHEIVHYYQWLECGNISERGVIVKARSMLRRYAAEVKRP
jgi:hypothetical protein